MKGFYHFNPKKVIKISIYLKRVVVVEVLRGL